ncbi:Na+/H+ antiporter subunit E [Bordetella sp. 2513F-2]
MPRLHLLLLPLFLFALWLLLNQSLSPGHLLLGAALAAWLGWASSRLRPLRSRPRRIGVMLRLLGRVAFDVARSNLEVAKLIWRPRSEMSPGFLSIPLDMRDPHGLAALACFLTYTPGTVWVDVSEDNVLTLHVLDLQNEAHWVSLVKDRYESALMEVFE